MSIGDLRGKDVHVYMNGIPIMIGRLRLVGNAYFAIRGAQFQRRQIVAISGDDRNGYIVSLKSDFAPSRLRCRDDWDSRRDRDQWADEQAEPNPLEREENDA